MENTEMLEIWRSYDKKLQENLVMNRKNADDITRIKIHSFLTSMKPIKLFTILVGLVWVLFIDMLILNLFHIANPFFLVSAAVQVILTKLALGIYLYQLILLHQADISDSVLLTQEKIARLTSTTIWVTRILFLQLPVWTTYYWNESMLQKGNAWLLLVQVLVTSLFTFLALWLFFHIKYENKDKKWFRLIFQGREWNPVMKSVELLKHVNEYK
jgi:hypothetical protein